MTLRAVVQEWSSGDPKIYPIAKSVGYGVWIDCKIVGPPSQEGKVVELLLTGEMIDKMIKELRHYAIEARR